MSHKHAIRHALEGFIASRHRHWFVIILTLLLGLTVIWPLADDYKASQDRYARLKSVLHNTQQDIASIDRFENVKQDRLEKLARLDAKTTGEKELQSFRERVIELARDSGCRVRTVRVDPMATRPWKKGEAVLSTTTVSATAKAPYTLSSQPVHLSVSGGIEGLKLLLEQLQRDGKLMHTKGFQLKPAGQTEPGQLIMDLDLLLFDLTERSAA